jgi:AmiR/NasT family two-component response regulator
VGPGRSLTIARENRAVIEQAKGILISRHGYTDDDAFAL